MNGRDKIPDSVSHSGGKPEFWKDELVREYEHHQYLVSEKKEEVLDNITRIIIYFCRLYSVDNPLILDVGCGPGSRTTLCAYVLRKVHNSVVVGVDASKEMIQAATENLTTGKKEGLSGYLSDFNSDRFWIPEIDNKYDFIVSSGALHYLSDRRRRPFLKEVFAHLKDDGALVACIGNMSAVPEIAEMEHLFRVEATYNQLEETKRPQDVEEFKKAFEEKDKKANINWQSHSEYLNCMKDAGFAKAEIVWHLWIRSIFVALK